MSKDDSKNKLRELGINLVEQVDKGKNPEIKFTLRNLSNIVYDQKTKTLKLGNKKSIRSFFNVAHAKKFLQTIEVASIIKRELLESGKHEHLRGIFYMAKRTIPDTNINIVDEQNESLAPDEPILVRVNNTLKFMTGSEILDYVKLQGTKIYDDGKKERYTNVGLKVCAFDQDYKIKELPATMVIKHPSNKIKEIITASGKSVKVTLGHSLFVSKNGLPEEAEVRNLNIGDWIAVPRKINVDIKSKEIDLVQKLIDNCPDDILSLLVLRANKFVINKILNNVGRKKLRKFVKIHYTSKLSQVLGNWRKFAIPLRLVKSLNLDLRRYYGELKISCKGAKHKYNCLIRCDKDFGLILGLLTSEGGHSISKRDGARILSISNKNREILEKFQESFIRSFGDSTAGKIGLCKDGTFRLNIGYDLLSYIFEFCLEYNVCHAWDKYLPSFLFDADEQMISSFIKWYRLGDGSITNNKAKLIRFHTTSLYLANGITFLLLRLGILSRIYKREPRSYNHHLSYEIRVGNREDVIKLAKITGDFIKDSISKTVNFSSDKLIGVAMLIRKNQDKLKLDDGAYKHFNWYEWDEQTRICRTTLINSTNLLSKYGKVDEKLKLISNYDIAWDKVVDIKDAVQPPYTVDLAVPNMQNFIGGNGLLILHNSDKAIEDLEVITGLSREQMHVSANKMGSMVGNIILDDSGDTIDCSRLGKGGYSIPSITDELIFKKIDANYILYMEKAAIFERLNEDKFWKKNNCILVTSQGQTTRGIRRLLQKLYEDKKIPIYVLADWDIYGAYIYSVIKYGSIALAHASEKLTIPGIKYLGITYQDIEKYGLQRHLIKMKDTDRDRIKQVSIYDWFKDNKDWQKQFETMKKLDAKAEIQALTARGISFISEKYLPEKIKNKDFID